MPINKPLQWFALALCFLLAACSSVQPQKAEKIAYLRYTDGFWQVWITDEKGHEHHQLSYSPIDKTRISWSAKRQEILCNNNDGTLVRIPVASGEETPVKLTVNGMLDAQWSPDGRQIAFSLNSTQRPDNNDLWVVNSDGTNLRKLTNTPGIVQMPSWQHQGQIIAYSSSSEDGTHDIWQLDMTSGSKEQLTIGQAFSFEPAYFGTSKIAYSTNQNGNYDIWLWQSHTAPKPVTHSPAYDAQPAWSADGEQIAFYSMRDNQKRIWIKHLKKQSPWPVTPADVLSRNPIWLQ